MVPLCMARLTYRDTVIYVVAIVVMTTAIALAIYALASLPR